MKKSIFILGTVLISLAMFFGFGEATRDHSQTLNGKNVKSCSSRGLVFDYVDSSLYILDPEMNTISGPYLSGELGEGFSLLQAAVTPDGRTAVISNNNSYSIFFVQLPERIDQPPILTDTMSIGYNAQDIVITPDGKYALIGYGSSETYIAVVDIESRFLITTYEFKHSKTISSMAISADGQTILVVDTPNNKIHVLQLNKEEKLAERNSITLNFKPGDIAVSPDGKTAIIVNPSEGSPAVLRIESPGNVFPVEETVPLDCHYGKAVVFSHDNSTAYYLAKSETENVIHLLNIEGPGIVANSGSKINTPFANVKKENKNYFDMIALENGGRYLYTAKKATNADNIGNISVIDLNTPKQIQQISGVKFPSSITFTCVSAEPDKPESNQPPFGSFDTPESSSTVRSSIALTGWALDDVGIESVKIYRKQNFVLEYIGDAIFSEGSRPDIATLYPSYPNNTRAGWGYMLLTNFLPYGGNGAYQIHVIARDTGGNEVTLGVKTIYCDNAHATKPFGAIDLPKPGETISGNNYRISGWALTPSPNKIAEDGSTINVRIDGQTIGHVTYNIYRSDIAALFPGYTNSNGAHGYMTFDTTRYSNGIHTIDWIVTDNAGNIDGIGSRFFSIKNEGIQPVEFTPGTNTTITSKTIGATGGTLEVTDSNSPLYKVKVEFPAGALSRKINASLGYNNGSLTANSGTFARKTISLNVPNINEFQQPVTITVPFSNERGIPVPYYVDVKGKLHPAQLISINASNKTFTFQTFHASLFTWIWEEITSLVPVNVMDTGFKPNVDGFQIENRGSTYNRGGECFGMTSFALWYFMNAKGSLGNFYPKYYNVIANDSEGNPLRGQNIIATRAFISITQKWNTYIPEVARQQTFSDEVKLGVIKNNITNTGNPVLIYLYHTNNSDGAHSVLAYAFNKVTGSISIYDPNYPGQTKKIEYNLNTKKFKTYSGFDGIVFNGDGTLNLTEPYQNILNDAESNFQGSGNATITINSHISGETVTKRNVDIYGIIESGQVLVTKLTIIVGSTPFSVNVGNNGHFNLTVSLESGINHMQFRTEGLDANNINLIPISNNIFDFTLNLNIPYSMILMTLTWDTNDTDLDTYVIDPTGDYSCFYHKKTADGGELDYDIVHGYGPEHWTLMSTDTIRYDRPYKFRVHYYSDHGNGPSNYTVSITVYEGTSREITYRYRGNVSVSNGANSRPTNTGPDWRDIVSITLTRGTADPMPITSAMG
ncbi:MAG TPA: hypothetical protein VK469_08430, partial [Candidatus Kapabacteria bacterium]|nr:hypothetical protein [Candidatus Kapabacteria bacterium]